MRCVHGLSSFGDDSTTRQRETSPGKKDDVTIFATAVDMVAERDKETEKLTQGMTLILAARDRVLTLSEQRVSHCSAVHGVVDTHTFSRYLAP